MTRRSNAVWALMPGLTLLLACHGELDTTRRPVARGTLGEEMHRIACQRIARDAFPSDVSGSRSRDLCRGLEAPAEDVGGRLLAAVNERGRTSAALDAMLPAATETELQTLMVALLPLYDPPAERLPRQTRTLAALLETVGSDDDAIAALGRMGARRGMRSSALQLGLVRPLLGYDGLPTLSREGLAAIAEGGGARTRFLDVLGAAALELATLEADDPEGEGTLDVVRALLETRDPSFDGGLDGRIVRRDERGLPVPASLSVGGFVDGDRDGLADVNDDGRFVDAGGAELDLPAPFALVVGPDENGVSRDDAGRALSAGGAPLFETIEVDGTLLAGLLREARPWLEGETPVLEDLSLAAAAQLGASLETTRSYGALEYPYEGFDTEESGAFELIHATAVLLDEPETREALSLASTLLRDHESEIAALIDAGLFGDALGDATPSADLAEDSELWDSILAVAADLADRPDVLRDLLVALSDPRSERLGQILAEMARHRDIQFLDSANGGRATPPLRDQEWRNEVNRGGRDTGANQSLLQQTFSIIHDLNGAEFCNREGAHMIINAPVVGRIDLMDNGVLDLFGLEQDPFPRCSLLRLENTTQAYILAIRGELDLEPQIRAALPGFLTTLTDIADRLGIDSLSIDGILEDNSGIPGLTTRPTPEAMNRLVYGEWNEFLNELLERPTTRDGIDVRTRHDGNVLLSWERRFRFCGDELRERAQGCSVGTEVMTFYEAFTPLLTVFAEADPGTSTPAEDYLFGKLISAIHLHYPSSTNGDYQSTNPNGARYALPDGAVTYEPILQALLGGCAWTGPLASRRCEAEAAGQLTTRLAELLRVADGLSFGGGRDGIDVLTDLAIVALDADLHPGLQNLDGHLVTATNRGSRTLPYSPIYLLLDALGDVDETWEERPERHERWLRARSTLVDLLLGVTREGDTFSLTNRRGHAMATILVDFLVERIDRHVVDGDLEAWAAGLTGRAQRQVGGPLVASVLRLLEALETETATRDAVFALLRYLLGEGEGEGLLELLAATHDLLQVMDDDENLIPLGAPLATALAPNVDAAIADGATLTTDGGLTTEAIELLREVAEVDEPDTFAGVLSRSVERPGDGSLATPIDQLLDVIANINRTAPGETTAFRAEDHRVLLSEVRDFLTDPERGLERLYAVLQTRGGE